VTSRASRTLGFLFADLRGYSAFVEAHGDDAAAELLRTYRDLMRERISAFEGAEIRTEGDSFYVVFPSASSGVRCGLAILRAATETPAGGPIRLGIGVHAGETTETEEGYVGSAVNIAARVCAQARAGELLVTETVRSLIGTRLPVRFTSRGARRLKGIRDPVHLYRVEELAGEATTAIGRPGLAERLRRSPGLLGVTIAAAVVLIIGVVGVNALVNDPGAAEPPIGVASQPMPTGSAATAQPSQTGVAEDQPFPNSAERTLLSQIDPDVGRHCERPSADDVPVHRYAPGEAGYSGPMLIEAGLRCPLGGGSEPDTVWYWAPTASWAGDELFFQMVGSRSLPAGQCGTDDRAYAEWNFGGASGRILCFADSRNAQIYWVYDGVRVIGTAIREDGDVRVLYRWWEDHARLLRPADEP
jgi:class 3 adenylate cyclase